MSYTDKQARLIGSVYGRLLHLGAATIEELRTECRLYGQGLVDADEILWALDQLSAEKIDRQSGGFFILPDRLLPKDEALEDKQAEHEASESYVDFIASMEDDPFEGKIHMTIENFDLDPFPHDRGCQCAQCEDEAMDPERERQSRAEENGICGLPHPENSHFTCYRESGHIGSGTCCRYSL